MKKRNDGGLFLPGHDGRPKGVPDAPGMHGPANARATEHGGTDMARNGRGKAHNSVPAHGGMTAQQKAMAGVGGMGHGTSAPDASAANPLAPEAPGKRLSPPMAHPSMRSRIADTAHAGAPGENHARNKGMFDPRIGRQILAEAESAPDDRAALAHMGVGINPLGRG